MSYKLLIDDDSMRREEERRGWINNRCGVEGEICDSSHVGGSYNDLVVVTAGVVVEEEVVVV